MRMRAASSGRGRGGHTAAPAAAASARLQVIGATVRRGGTGRLTANAVATVLLTLLTLLGAAFGANNVAGAAPYPPTTPCGVTTYTAYIDADSVGLGLSAWGFVPGDRVDVALGAPAVRTATYDASADGSLRTVLDVPRSWASTSHTIRASSASGFCYASSRAIAGAGPGPRPSAPGRPGAGSTPGGGGSGGSSGSPGRPGASGGPGGTTDGPAGSTGSTGSSSGVAGTSGAPATTPAPGRSGSTGPAPAAAEPGPAAPSFIGVPAWLIALISLGLLVIGLLAARAMTSRGD